MDGFEVLAAMRDQKIICHIPVVILTAQKLSYEDMDRLQLGVAAVLGKDLFSEAEVLSQIEAALARSGRLGTEAQRIVRKAMVYIHTHFEEDLSRNALAEALCVSDNYLGRCFIKELRLTPITYLNRFRVQQARKRFEKGESNITEVANEVGFSDSNYFGRVFRREVGVSPSAYLRGKRAEDALSRTVS
jgi:YesN/AraC family two-component response regulator